MDVLPSTQCLFSECDLALTTWGIQVFRGRYNGDSRSREDVRKLVKNPREVTDCFIKIGGRSIGRPCPP